MSAIIAWLRDLIAQIYAGIGDVGEDEEIGRAHV